MAIETVTYEQFFGVNQALNLRLNKEAQYVGDRAANKAMERMQQDQDLFVEDGLDLYVQRERERAERALYDDANTGRYNSEIYNSAGFVALFSVEASGPRRDLFGNDLEYLAAEQGGPFQLFDVECGPEDVAMLGISTRFGLISTNFMRGSVRDTFPVYPLITEAPELPIHFGGVMSFGRDEFVRIETKDGELWQNPNYTPQGVLR